MFFFHDECDFVDDDQYDFFTLAIQIERRNKRSAGQNRGACRRASPVEFERLTPAGSGFARGTSKAVLRR